MQFSRASVSVVLVSLCFSFTPSFMLLPAFAQSVGSRVVCSPYSLDNQWLPGTVTAADSNGFTVLLDPRPGYGSNEEYHVSKKWVRPGGGAAPAPASSGGSPSNGSAAGNGAGPGSFAVGQRVSANAISVYKDEYWKPGVITQMLPGAYAIKFDDSGLEMVVKDKNVRPGSAAMPAAGNNVTTNTGNQTTPPAPTNGAATPPRGPVVQTPKHVPGKGTPPDGTYTITMLTGGMLITIGTLEISGNTYRGLNKTAGFHPYNIDGTGNMVFSGGLSGMPDGFKLTSSGYEGTDNYGRPLIKIRYVGPTNTHDTMDAIKQ